MSRNLANSGFYDEGLIDHRNERPLAVAFATIVRRLPTMQLATENPPYRATYVLRGLASLPVTF